MLLRISNARSCSSRRLCPCLCRQLGTRSRGQRPVTLPFFTEDVNYREQDFPGDGPGRSPHQMRNFRILSLDGGGVRGVLTSVLLQRIQQAVPDWLSHVDLIAGTSTGGIVALMLAAGYSPKQVQEVYTYWGSTIFERSIWRQYNPFTSKYGDQSKLHVMQEYFGERTMADLQYTTAIVAFRLDGRKSKTHRFFDKEGWRPAIFSNMPRAAGFVEPDMDLNVFDAAMRTSAAPTYFPIYQGYCDGGIVANNPAALALSKVCAHYPTITPANCVVLSLGSGSFPRQLDLGLSVGQSTDWGLREWSPVLLDLLIEGDSVTVEMMLHYMLGRNDKYHRLDPKLKKFIAIDALESVDELIAVGHEVDLTTTIAFVKKHFTSEPRDGHFEAESADGDNYTNAWMNHVAHW